MKKFIFIAILILIIVLGVIGVIVRKFMASDGLKPINSKGGNMKLTTDFEHNQKIPSKYTCDGEDLAPQLDISGVPENAKSLALIVDDPDAPMGTWVHWVVFNLPADAEKIDAKNLPKEAKQGITDFGRVGWGGPCPPSGTHRYFFKLYALDTVLELQAGITKFALENAMGGHVLEKTELIGLYKRG